VGIPALWIYGPPGVGKTSVAWAAYTDLLRSGVRVGFVDIDQLGMCYPEQPDDRGRYRLAATNLAAVAAGHRAAGAEAIVVSGVVDPVRGRPEVPGLAITGCRLRADPGELTARLVARTGSGAQAAKAVAEGELLNRLVSSDSWVDTTSRPVDEVVRLVQDVTAGWLDRTTTSTAPPLSQCDADGRVLWLCGATGVGKSSVGFPSFLRHLPGAFVDLDQIGFFPSSGTNTHQVRAEILASMWSTFHTAGAERLTVVGPVGSRDDVAQYQRALPHSELIVCRLHASANDLTNRVLSRATGSGWSQPGDPLRGRSAAELHQIARRAVAEANRLDAHGVGHLRIDTDGLNPIEVAEAVDAIIG